AKTLYANRRHRRLLRARRERPRRRAAEQRDELAPLHSISSLSPSYHRCVYRKSDSAVLVMKAAKERLGCDDAEALDRPMEWGILVQRAMNARFVIIRGILAQDPAQVRLPKHDQVVETFPADRTDQPLDVRVLPRRSGARSACPECPWRANAARRAGH